jgi:hypothetical protein
MTEFVKGLDLCESFFREIARPILSREFPSLRYSAGVIGAGSEVLGFDDAMSSDHMWGPRFQLFLPEEGFDARRDQVAAALSTGFPYEYRGFSTNFSPPDPGDGGVRKQEPVLEGPIDPLVETHTLRSYCEDYLGYTPFEEISVAQWLTFPEHRLLGVTSGRVFHDDLGLLAVREKLGYYPHDIWLWMMAAQWTMIAEEEAFVGRCGLVGDELGSAVIAGRQVQRIMRLCFLMEKRYAPYGKWFGTAFKRLEIAPALAPILENVLRASHWKEREGYLGRACTIVAEKHNTLDLTGELSSAIRPYFGRPFRVLSAERFAEALAEKIHDPELKALIPDIGSVSQFSDSTKVYDDVGLAAKLKHLYQ